MFKKLLNIFGSGKSDSKATDIPLTEELKNTFSIENAGNNSENNDCDDNYNENTNKPVVKRLAGKKANLDSDTLHGSHYTIEEFDEEIKRRVDRFIKSEQEDGETVTEEDIFSMTTNAMDEVYCDWNGFHRGHDAMINFRNRHSKKYLGHASFGYEKMEDNVDNPLLEPIHGVTLEDYAAVSYKIASGTNFISIMEMLGVDPAIWPEINTLWGKRMEEDPTFTVTTMFTQFYNTADQHPKLFKGLQVEMSDKEMIEEKDAKMEEYKKKLAEEQGGNVADDINF